MTIATQKSPLQSIALWLTLSVLLVAVAGCGGSKGNVSGLVKFNGSPLPEGKITFICQGGRGDAPSARIHDGKYEIKGVPVGPVKITVATYKIAQNPALPPPGLKPIKPPNTEPSVPAGQYVQIPLHYSQVDQTNLSYVVTSGDQEHSIDLQPGQ